MTTPREEITGFAALMDERARIADYLVQHVERTLGTTPGFLGASSAHVLSAPGKLLRPLLLLDACRAAGGDPDLVFPAAVGTEFGHIASLIHDDIIDGDSMRRGQETLHTKYGPAVAILTGDFLLFNTFLTYTQCHERGVPAELVLDAIRTLSETCIDICKGQALEAELAGQMDTPEQAYLDMIALKTAGVCRAAAWIGARLGGASYDQSGILGDYGHSLGMAFQIIDDALAYDGSQERVGKPSQSDVRNRRVTLPVIYALEAGGEDARRRVTALFALEAGGDEVYGEMARLLEETHALERTRALAYRYTARAKSCLDQMPDSEARARLHAVADIALARDY